MNTITRKIKIILMEDVKESYKKLYEWNEQCFRAANIAMSHMFFQNKMNEFFYLTDSAKILFADINKVSDDDNGERVLNTSKMNTTYQVLSSNFKGKMPADIFSNLNAQLVSKFNKEKKEYFSGKRSLASYRRDMPMPFSAKSMRNIVPSEDKRNYSFDLFGLKFKTWFGKDLSGNRIIFDRALSGEYKLCNSSIQLDGKDIFLLAVFQFESTKFELDEEKVMYAELSASFPIVLNSGKRSFNVGDKKEYLHRRIAIQASMRRQQIAARYNINGKGRVNKMANTERFHKMESDYISTRQHQYTRKMIDLCLQNKCGKLMLKLTPELPEPEDMTIHDLRKWREENQLLLRNWGYRGLKDKISYKAKKVGIELIEE
jgi:hypothetical protein